ncbi:hypothetical protein [Mucilaginibacter rubeus]|uniref:hypothetical protein n=1 Tax=Mucilaginibacter rubeus TaxID=2027860 RepID=UPI0039772B3A
MRAVKSKNTAPEILVRKLIYKLGYRYRLHNVSLPGKPDIIFTKRKKVIFIHGCFGMVIIVQGVIGYLPATQNTGFKKLKKIDPVII